MNPVNKVIQVWTVNQDNKVHADLKANKVCPVWTAWTDVMEKASREISDQRVSQVLQVHQDPPDNLSADLIQFQFQECFYLSDKTSNTCIRSITDTSAQIYYET